MRDFSLLKKRILQYIENKGISKYEFYQKTGISNGILSQKNGLSEENTLKFLSYYTDISPDWLLSGKGDMIKIETEDLSNRISSDINTEMLEYIEQLKEKNDLLEKLRENDKTEMQRMQKIINELKNKLINLDKHNK